MNTSIAKTFGKRMLVSLLSVTMILTGFALPGGISKAQAATTFKDVKGHWAEKYIEEAVNKGFVKGYPDGTYLPDKAITRAEFTSMVNKALGNNATVGLTFTDVPYSEWYYSDVAKGVSAAFVGGYDDGSFKPNQNVTREEAAVMMSRIVPTAGSSKSVSGFADSSKISDWSQDAVSKVYAKGYMGGYDDGKYHPQDALTRAQIAKIMCDVVNKESIVKSNTTVSSKGTTLSGRIYSNNVTIAKDINDGDATMSNCVVLGTLYVYGGGENSVKLANSRIANANVERSSDTVRVVASGQTFVNKTITGNSAILEASTSGSSSYNPTGFNEVSLKASADTKLSGTFNKVNLEGSSAKLDLESGKIGVLNVTNSGRYAKVNVNSRASVTTANVNAQADFTGSGTINTMNVNSSNVTYATKPVNVKIGSGISSPTLGDDEDLEIDVTPSNKATRVSRTATVKLKFDSAVETYDGKTIKASNISDIVSIRKGSSSGSKMSFDGSIDSSKKTITLEMDSKFADDTRYYIVIPKNVVRYTKNEKGNGAQTTWFSTGDDDEGDTTTEITVDPKNKKTNVSLTSDIKLTFKSAITMYNGNTPTASKIENEIEIRKNSSSGKLVSYSASIDSAKKKITLDPDSKLEDDMKYYVIIPKNAFKYSDGSGNAKQTTWFSTGDEGDSGDLTFYPKNGATGVSTSVEPYITFDEAIETYDGKSSISASYLQNNIVFRKNSSSGTKVQFTASYNSSKKRITIEPKYKLDDRTKYYLEVPNKVFRTEKGRETIGKASVVWTVGDLDTAPTVKFTPANGETNVLVKPRITIQFSATMYDSSKKSINNNIDSYIRNSLTFKNAHTGATVNYDIIDTTNYAGGGRIVIMPSSNLQEGNKYTISVSGSRFQDSQGTYCKGGSATFTVAGNIDLSKLNLAILNAEDARKNVKQSSKSGTDVYTSLKWVTPEVWSKLDEEIKTATKAKETATSTTVADAAATRLEAAITVFNQAKQEGSKERVDTSALQFSIDEAKEAKSGVRTGVTGYEYTASVKWVTSAEMKALNDAISLAQSREAEVDSLTNVSKYARELDQATSDFKEVIKTGLKPNWDELVTVVANANAKIKGVVESEDGSNVPSNKEWIERGRYEAFASVIEEAQAMIDSLKQNEAISQTQVDNMVSKLSSAMDAFTPQPGNED